jgi:hypothetical protein
MLSTELVKTRLDNQGISKSILQFPGDVVKWLCAVQAQDYFGAKWALGLRLTGSIDTDIEQAFNTGEILRTHVLRPTWHFVIPADIRWLLKLTAPRVHAKSTYMYRKMGLDSELLIRGGNIFVKALQGGNQLTRDELFAALGRSGIVIDQNLQMVYFLMFAELEGLICSGPRRGKQFTYALLDERAPNGNSFGYEESLHVLADRYFKSRGPATVHDFAKWSGLKISDAKCGIDAVRFQLQKEMINGQEYWFPPLMQSPTRYSPEAHLLSIYDEYVSSYKNHGSLRTTEIGAKLVSMGNDLTNIIVMDGRIIGTWKRTITKSSVLVKPTLFVELSANEKEALAMAADRYGDFLQLEVILA